jgi:hypothetical protein
MRRIVYCTYFEHLVMYIIFKIIFINIFNIYCPTHAPASTPMLGRSAKSFKAHLLLRSRYLRCIHIDSNDLLEPTDRYSDINKIAGNSHPPLAHAERKKSLSTHFTKPKALAWLDEDDPMYRVDPKVARKRHRRYESLRAAKMPQVVDEYGNQKYKLPMLPVSVVKRQCIYA